LADLFPIPVGSPFGGNPSPAPTPVSAPMPAPSFAAPSMAAPRQAPGPPNFQQMLVPILASIVAGRGDPAATGAGLAAFAKGKRLKRAEREDDMTRTTREQRERAEFYSRMVQNAQQFDDPVAFEQLKQAIAPMADVYGVPLESVVFSDTKRKARDQKLVQDALDTAVKRHGPEILNRPDVSVRLADGRTLSMPTARNLLGGEVTASGTPVPVRTSTPFSANTPEEMAIAAKARELGKKPEDLTLEELTAARSAGKPTTAATPGSFEAFTTETDPAKRAKILGDRKLYQQSDDRPRVTVDVGGRNPREVATFNQIAGAYDRSPLIRAADRTIVLSNAIAQIEKNPSDPASQLSLAYSYIQALDTYQSAVREGELQNLGILGTRLQSFVTQLNRVANEGAFLPPAVAQNIASNAKQLVQTIEAGRSNKEREFASRAKTSGVGDMWSEFTAGMKPPVVTPPAGGGGGLGSYQEYLNSQKKGAK
jgi:hypothetical protein